jgi:flagellar hook-basal body complex protein FliE
MVVDPMRVPGLGRQGLEVSATQMRPARPAVSLKGASFKEVLADAVGEVQRLQDEADVTIKKLVAGDIKDVSEAMVAVEKADVSFQTFMAVRNKVLNAYQEIMRMQI